LLSVKGLYNKLVYHQLLQCQTIRPCTARYGRLQLWMGKPHLDKSGWGGVGKQVLYADVHYGTSNFWQASDTC